MKNNLFFFCCLLFYISNFNALKTNEIAPSCSDTAANCEKYSHLCTNEEYNSMLSTICKKTCHFCNTNSKLPIHLNITSNDASCENLISDCDSHKNLCTDSLYKDFMQQRCPITCGYCKHPKKETSLHECIDIDTNCESNIKFCSIPFFVHSMRQKCIKSCGYCNINKGISSQYIL